MKFKALGDRILSILLAVSIFFTGFHFSAREAEAGLIAGVIARKWVGVTSEILERSIITGLDKAADCTDNDDLATALSWTGRIIGGRSEYLDDDTLELVKELSEEVDSLYACTVTSDNEIRDMLKLIISNEERNAFNEKLTAVTTFGSNYEGMLRSYSELFDALKEYGEHPSQENKSILADKYSYVYYHYYEDMDARRSFLEPLMGTTSSAGFLATISPYDQNQSITSEADMTGNWRLRSGLGTTKTYLDSYYSYILTVSDLENNVHDSMKAAARLAVNASYQYIQAYRYFAELSSIMINSDASMDEEEKEARLKTIWSDFNDSGLRLERAINQMVCLYDGQADSAYDENFPNVYCGFMRDYDLESIVTIKDYKERESVYEIYRDPTLHFHDHVKLLTSDDYWKELVLKATQPMTQHVYQFKLATETENTAYAIRRRETDKRRFLAENSTAKSRGSDTIPSLDLFNFLRGTENGYLSPTSILDFAPIAENNTAYEDSGNLTQYIKKELSYYLGAENVDIPVFPVTPAGSSDSQKKKGPGFLVLATENYYSDRIFTDHHDTDTTWANISMPFGRELDVSVDLEDDILEHCGEKGYLYDTDLVVMYKGSPTTLLSIEAGSGGSTVVENEGKEIGGRDSTVTCGSMLKIRVKPDEGYTLDRLSLNDVNGRELECLMKDVMSDEGEETEAGRGTVKVSTQELLQMIARDQDGYYDFYLPVPYQYATLKASWRREDPSLIPYKVTLNDVTGFEDGKTVKYALTQFGGYDYIGEKNFKKGSPVTVSVTGYHNRIASGLILKDKSGKRMNGVEVKDISSESLCLSPAERIYRFSMPAEDVYVEAEVSEQYPVTVNDTQHITHIFKDLTGYDNAQGTDISSISRAGSAGFSAQAAVKLGFEAEKGYLLSRIDVYNAKNRKALPVRMTDDGIAFEMPESGVMVQLYEERQNLHYHLAVLDTERTDVSLSFTDDYGQPFNVAKRQIREGKTVRVRAKPEDDSSGIERAVIKDESGRELSFEALSGSLDRNTGSFSFIMPAENVTVSAVPGAGAPNDISDEESFILTPPEDTVYNGREQKMPFTLASKGNTVLTEGEDYEALYSDAVNIGTVNVTIRGKGLYTGLRYTSYQILAKTPECRITEDPSKVYDGKPAEEPEVSCDSGGNIDYKWYEIKEDGSAVLLKSAPSDAGSYRVEAYAEASGDFDAGRAFLDFTIEPAAAILDLSAVQEGDTARVRGVVFGLLSVDGTVTFVITPKDSEEITTKTVNVAYNGNYYLGEIKGQELPAGEYTVTAVYHSSSGNYTGSRMTKTFTEGKRRSIAVEESFIRTYGDKGFGLEAKTDSTNGSDHWSYEVISDDFLLLPAGTSNAAAAKSITVTQGGEVSVKHAGRAVIKITLEDTSGAPPEERFYETCAYVTVEVRKAPLTVTSYSLPSVIEEGGLSEVSCGLKFSGFKNGDTRDNFTHGFGTLSAVPVPEASPASRTPYMIGIQKNGVACKIANRTVNGLFVSRDYDITCVYGTLTVTEEPQGRVIPVKSASLDEGELHLGCGEQAGLKLAISPGNTNFTSVIWLSADENIAALDNDGNVTGISPGETTVRAIVHSRTGKLKGVTVSPSCKVYVTEKKVQGVTLDTYDASLCVGDKLPLNAAVYPLDAEDRAVSFESSDPSVASYENGFVFAKSAGSALISAKAGDKAAVCTVTVKDEIDPADEALSSDHEGIPELWIGGLADQVYTGERIEPETRVYYGNHRLVKGTDYFLSFKDNINAGKAYAVISPGGSCAFEKETVTFKILPVSITDPAVTITPVIAKTVMKKGEYVVQRLVPDIRYAGRSLKKDKDFTVDYGAVGEPGTYQKAGSYKLHITGTGNFTGDMLTYETLFDEGTRFDISKAEIRLKAGSSKEYSYDPAKPDTEFRPQYELYSKQVIDGMTVVKRLAEGRDYSCSYSGNSKPGRAYAVFTALPSGDYYGAAGQAFTIKKVRKDISLCEVYFPGGKSVPYERDGAKPSIEVKDGGRILKEGTDYTVSYKNNRTAEGSKRPELTVKGKGYYTGRKTESFTIEKADLADAVLIIDDFIYSKKAYGYKKVKFTLADGRGRKLGRKDYLIKGWEAVSSRPEPGTCVLMTLQGSGSYKGSISGSFRIIDKAQRLSTTKVKVADQVFEGSPVYPSAGDITVTLKSGGKTKTLVYGTDYLITGYQDNDKAGKAGVTIRGIGDYGGLKSAGFRIRKAR